MNSPELDRINASQAQRLKESACRRAVAQTAGVGSLTLCMISISLPHLLQRYS